MREKKKVLKFKKFKIAQLRASFVIGGTNSDPIEVTTTVPSETHQQSPVTNDASCESSGVYYDNQCTKGRLLTNEDASDCQN